MTFSTLADGSASAFLNPVVQHDGRKAAADALLAPGGLNWLAQMSLQDRVSPTWRDSRRTSSRAAAHKSYAHAIALTCRSIIDRRSAESEPGKHLDA
jgi:hypothetical protein